ncbi:MAG: GDSL-type esterase/lipase family protein [Oceanococcus sp.]
MRHQILWKKIVILLCFSLLAAACSRETVPTLEWISNDGVILAFGDSLTHGTGTTKDKAYPSVLAQLIDRTVAVEATPGDKTSDGLEKLAAALDEHHPNLLLLCLGGNDFLRKVDTQTTIENLQRMIAIADRKGVQVLLIGVPKPVIFGLESHPLYKELAKQYRLPLEADAIAKVLANSATKSDAFHPNADGYQLVAQAIAELLRKTGAI